MPIIRDGRFITEIRHGARRISVAYQGSRRIYTDGPIQHPPEQHEWNVGNYYYRIPFWAAYIDVVCLGGGGAGGNGGGAAARAGEGGRAGEWGTARVAVAHLPTRDLTITVAGTVPSTSGQGGGASGADGNETRVLDALHGGTVGNHGPGGRGGRGALADSSRTNGQSPGTRTFMGQTYQGGGETAYRDNAQALGGRPPGGGGAGGAGGVFGVHWAGGGGAGGRVWITARTRAEVEG